MKKTVLIFGLFLPFILQSCVNHNYDLDDEKIDKNVEFSPDGINLPVGNIDTIWVADELQKKYDGGINSRIEFDSDGLLYLEYADKFDFSWQYDLNEVKPEITATNLVADVNGIPLTGSIILPAELNVPLIEPSTTSYDVGDVKLIEESDLTIKPKKVKFNNFAVNLSIALKDIVFSTGKENARLVLEVTFPNGFALNNPSNTITKEIPLQDIPANGNFYFVDKAQVISFDYEVENTNLSYKLYLKTGAPLSANVSANPKFELQLDVDNSAISLSDLTCVLSGSKTFSDEVKNFDQLYSSFTSKGDVLEFIKPYLNFDLATNLVGDFLMDVELINDRDKAYAYGLQHKKGIEKNQYVLSDEGVVTLPGKTSVDFHNLNQVISVLPEQLKYNIALRFENETVILQPSKAINLHADYLFNLPFNFGKVDVTFTDKVDLGEDLYSDLFEYATGNISITADDVTLFIDDNLNVSLSAAILDGNNNPILRFDNVLDETRTPNLFINIPKKDNSFRYLENAKYLEFRFELKGQEVDVTRNDFIRINKIRIISDSGIHFEL